MSEETEVQTSSHHRDAYLRLGPGSFLYALRYQVPSRKQANLVSGRCLLSARADLGGAVGLQTQMSVEVGGRRESSPIRTFGSTESCRYDFLRPDFLGCLGSLP